MLLRYASQMRPLVERAATRHHHLLRLTVSTAGASYYHVNRLHKTFRQLTARYFSASPITSKSFTPSPEQQQIVDLCRTQNVIVSARPGSGKTATARCIVEAMPESHVVIVTYSKALQQETVKRLADQKDHCDIYTFHGMAGRLFGSTMLNDQYLRAARRKGIKPAWNGPLYDVVVLDEFQDCTPDLYWLTCAFLEALIRAKEGSPPRLVVLGDERQCIYQFRDADARHLSLAPATLGSLSPYPWSHVSLPRSFRLSRENTDFLNRVYLGGENYVQGTHSSSKPLYVHCDHRSLYHDAWVKQTLVPMIRRYGPENTAIIAPHVRNNFPLADLTNLLTDRYKFPVAVSVSDDVMLDNDVLHGKINVSTFHQFKGKERDLVMVFGVDDSYLTKIARGAPNHTCPNGFFVALTRAKKQLIVTHNATYGPLPFMSLPDITKTADYIDLMKRDMKPPRQVTVPKRAILMPLPCNTVVTDMARHLENGALEAIINKHITVEMVTRPLPKREHINAPDKILTNKEKKFYEIVSDINGMAVVGMYELTILGTLKSMGFATKPVALSSNDPRERAIWLCRKACRYDAYVSRFRSRWFQMRHMKFDWLVNHLQAAKERLTKRFEGTEVAEGTVQFEVPWKQPAFWMPEKQGGEEGMPPPPPEVITAAIQISGKPEDREEVSWPGYQHTTIRGRADIVQQASTPLFSSSTLGRLWSAVIKNKPFNPNPNPNPATIWEIKLVNRLSTEHIVQLAAYGYLWCSQQGFYTSPSPSPSPETAPLPPLPEMRLYNVNDGEERIVRPRNGAQSLNDLVEDVLRLKHTLRPGLSTEEFLKKCEGMRNWGRDLGEGPGVKISEPSRRVLSKL